MFDSIRLNIYQNGRFFSDLVSIEDSDDAYVDTPCWDGIHGLNFNSVIDSRVTANAMLVSCSHECSVLIRSGNDLIVPRQVDVACVGIIAKTRQCNPIIQLNTRRASRRVARHAPWKVNFCQHTKSKHDGRSTKTYVHTYIHDSTFHI